MASSAHKYSSLFHHHHLPLVFLLLAAAAAAAAFPVTSEFELGPRRHTYFRVYFHETFLGPENTTVTVVQRNLPNTFGDVGIFDAVLRAGPHNSSRAIGRAQGASFWSSQREPAALTPLVLVFTDGELCDSSLTVIGRMDASGRADRAIVGGTGRFQFAWGNMVSELVTSSDEGLVAVFDVFVVNYEDVVRVKASA